MKVICVGWSKTHPVPIVIKDDGLPGISYGMCPECAATYGKEPKPPKREK